MSRVARFEYEDGSPSPVSTKAPAERYRSGEEPRYYAYWADAAEAHEAGETALLDQHHHGARIARLDVARSYAGEYPENDDHHATTLSSRHFLDPFGAPPGEGFEGDREAMEAMHASHDSQAHGDLDAMVEYWLSGEMGNWGAHAPTAEGMSDEDAVMRFLDRAPKARSSDPDHTLYRGLTLMREEVAELARREGSHFATQRPFSFTPHQGIAEGFSAWALDEGRVPVKMRLKNHATFPIKALSEHPGVQASRDYLGIFNEQSEHILRHDNTIRIDRVHHDGKEYIVDLTQLTDG